MAAKATAPAKNAVDETDVDADQAPPDDEPDHVSEVIDTPADAPLAVKIAHAMAEAQRVVKSRQANQGAGGNYKYAGAEAILAAVRAPLFRRGVTVLPDLEEAIEHTIRSSNDKEGTRIVITVAFEFSDGVSTIVKRWKGEGQDYGDKAFGKAYTNAVKTFVRTAWLLPTEHDDPEASPSGERAAAGAPAWAMPLGKTDHAKALKAAAVNALADVIGHQPTTVEYIGKLADVAGGLPVGVAGWLSQLPGWIEAGAKASADGARTAQDADAEAPDTPAPEPEPHHDPDSVDPVDVPPPDAPASTAPVAPPAGWDHWPTAEDFLERVALERKQNGETTGLKVGEDALRAAGCTCPDPLGIRGPATKDDACPFLDHGIPF